MRNPRFLAPIALVAAAAGCAGVATAPPAPADYAFVLLGPGGVAVVRAITSATTCPSLVVDGAAQAMSVRAPAATIAQRPTQKSVGAAKPSAFPVTTCETMLPAGTARASLDGRSLPLPKAQPRRIVVIGDTGCRILGAKAQACNDPAAWPFERIARAAAATAPDLVVHVGDYHYRETACPSSQPGCRGSPWGYGWDAWEADLFTPARALFRAAPWVVVRGNHEVCARAGQGWWRFLDPRPPAPGQDCNLAADDATGDLSEPYAVPIGGGRTLLVFDSAGIEDAGKREEIRRFDAYRAQMARAFALAPGDDALFLVHNPPLAFTPNPRRPGSPRPGDRDLQAVLAALLGEAYFPPRVRAVFSGEIHMFQAVGFASDHPAQFVTGNGGDWIDERIPVPAPAGAAPAPGTTVDMLAATNRFGFVVMDRTSAGWNLRLHGVDGASMSTCTLVGRRARCTPIIDPWVAPPS